MSTTADPIGQVRAILREVMESPWPDSREAMRAIGNARYYLLGEMDVHSHLVNDEMGWREFDPDLLFFDGDPQEQAVAIAAERALDAAKALRNRLAEYRHREVSAREVAA